MSKLISDFTFKQITTLAEAISAAELVSRIFVTSNPAQLALKVTYEQFCADLKEYLINTSLSEPLSFCVVYNPTQQIVGAMLSSSLFGDNGIPLPYNIESTCETDSAILDILRDTFRDLNSKGAFKPKEFNYLHLKFIAHTIASVLTLLAYLLLLVLVFALEHHLFVLKLIMQSIDLQ